MKRNDEQFKAAIYRRKEWYEAKRRTRIAVLYSGGAALVACLILTVILLPGFQPKQGEKPSYEVGAEEQSVADVLVTVSAGDLVWTDPEAVAVRWAALARYVPLPEGSDTVSPEDSAVPESSPGDALIPESSGNDAQSEPSDSGSSDHIAVTVTAGDASQVYYIYSDCIRTADLTVPLSADQIAVLRALFSSGN